ncbi:MAG: hypothetical protein U0936_10205 [Planctomycetaceae bacterium]
MTGYTVHTGASKKFVSGWDKVFGNTPAEPSKKEASAAAEEKKNKAGKSKKDKKKKK